MSADNVPEDEVDSFAPLERPAPPPREEIRIVDAARRRVRTCSVCGQPRKPHIVIDVDGVPESTCRECYERRTGPQTTRAVAERCRSCGQALFVGDSFCGRCGAPAAYECPKCGAGAAKGDAFCGRCGTSLSAAP